MGGQWRGLEVWRVCSARRREGGREGGRDRGREERDVMGEWIYVHNETSQKCNAQHTECPNTQSSTNTK